MKIQRLILDNFRGFKQLELTLDQQITIFAGINGSGKTSILKSVAVLLSWIISRTRTQNGAGLPLHPDDIRNKADYTQIRAEMEDPHFAWQLVKVRPARRAPEARTQLGELNLYTRQLQELITTSQEQCSLPVFVHYPVDRAVLDVPLRIRKAHDFGLLEAWEHAFSGGSNFRSFFEWFRNREDLENQNHRVLHEEPKPPGWAFPDPQLDAVRKALSSFLPEFKDMKVSRKPLRLVVSKNGESLSVQQLSDGEKGTMALVGDLARRLAIANPTLKNPLEGEGIVLIDEIDLHLHPSWQRQVVPRLSETFPNCQFLITTHSPQVLGEIRPESLRLLDLEIPWCSPLLPKKEIETDQVSRIPEIGLVLG